MISASNQNHWSYTPKSEWRIRGAYHELIESNVSPISTPESQRAIFYEQMAFMFHDLSTVTDNPDREKSFRDKSRRYGQLSYKTRTRTISS